MLWYPVALLPNLRIQGSDSVDVDPARVASAGDELVCEIGAVHPEFEALLNRFSNTFSRQHRPSVLLLRPNAAASYRSTDAIASVRNILSMSVVPLARVRHADGKPTASLCYSNVFDFYPWMIDTEFQNVILRTPGLNAIDQVEKFRGQIAPEFATPAALSYGDIDVPMLGRLAKCWKMAYGRQKESNRHRRLMRSLNMAHQAGQLPGNQDTTKLDWGRVTALWVAALEILAHSGKGRVDFWDVLDLLERVNWRNRKNLRKQFKIRAKGNKKTYNRRCRVCRVYERLYDSRNDFLHGNPIYKRSLFLGKIPLHTMGSLLYRMAISAFLDVRVPEVPKDWVGMDKDGIARIARCVSDRMDFKKIHATFEKGITACGAMRRIQR